MTKRKPQEVRLGFAVGSGAPVLIPVGHMCVTGMTQQAGKTTALEGLIRRAKVTAVTFVTKRGEGSFQGGHSLPPYFRERADWVFVSSLIDATMGEKNKFLRSWLMRVCRNTRTLAEVHANVLAAKDKARGFPESIYTEIEGYLDLVVPQLKALPAATSLTLKADALNVMDLTPYSDELQALVIRSVLEHIYDREMGVVTVIPEAWQFLPEGRGSPVKREAETLIRKGAALGNFVWLDSQDLAGVWKLAVRACPVYLVGVQREANEIKRTLSNIHGAAAPKAADVARLEIGQFYACWGAHAIKTYAQPAWMSGHVAKAVATGELSVLDAIADNAPAEGEVTVLHDPVEVLVTEMEARALREENARLKRTVDELTRQIKELTDAISPPKLSVQDAARASLEAQALPAETTETVRAKESERNLEELDRHMFNTPIPLEDLSEDVYQVLKRRLLKDAQTDPAILQVLTKVPELHVTVERQTIDATGDSLRGRVARLLKEGFFAKAVLLSNVTKELERRGYGADERNLRRELETLASFGFFTIEDVKDDKSRTRKGYLAVPGMQVHVRERAA